MAYTRAWNDSTPAGTRAANQIDDAIREFKVDVHERMNALVTDWTTDPIVPLASLNGQVTGKQLVFGPHIMINRNDEDDVGHQDQYVDTDGNASVIGSLALPLGITITAFEATCDPLVAVAATVEFFKVLLATGVKTSIVSITRAVVGVGACTPSGVLAEVTDATWVYGVRFSASSSGGHYYGCRLTYNTPDSRNTI